MVIKPLNEKKKLSKINIRNSNYFLFLKSLSLSLKSQKLTDMGITSLLFDFNYKYIDGAFAFIALTKSIY